MKRKLLISIILITLLFILAGCGYGELKGNVIDKQYTPAKTTMIPVKAGKVTSIMPVHHPERYEIKFKKRRRWRNKKKQRG